MPDEDGPSDEPLFDPDALEAHLQETIEPLVIDIDPLRMCSEERLLLANEIIRILEKTIEHFRKILPTMPLHRHMQIVVLRGLPGSFALHSQQTPWGRGAGFIYKHLRDKLVFALTAEGMQCELVPSDIMEPETPTDADSQLSVDLVVKDDQDSGVVLSDPDDEDIQ